MVDGGYLVLPVNPSGPLIINGLTRQTTRQPSVSEPSGYSRLRACFKIGRGLLRLFCPWPSLARSLQPARGCSERAASATAKIPRRKPFLRILKQALRSRPLLQILFGGSRGNPTRKIEQPTSLIPHPSSAIPHSPSRTRHPAPAIPHPPSLIHHPSSLTLAPVEGVAWEVWSCLIRQKWLRELSMNEPNSGRSRARPRLA